MSLFDAAVEAIGIPESDRPQVRRMLLCEQACRGFTDDELQHFGLGYLPRLHREAHPQRTAAAARNSAAATEGNNVEGSSAAVDVSNNGKDSAGAE